MNNLHWMIDPDCLESRHNPTLIARVYGACFEIEHLLGRYRATHNTPDDTHILSKNLNETQDECKLECEQYYLDHYTDYLKLKSERENEALALNTCTDATQFRKHVQRIEQLDFAISDLID